MEKLTDDDLLAVARAQSLNKYGDPERRGIYANSFFMGALFIRDENKKPSEVELKKHAKEFANSSYYTNDRIEIGQKSFIDGSNYILKR